MRASKHKFLDVLLVVLFSLAFCPIATSARLNNVTIDDTYGDPNTGGQVVYTPQGAWQQGNGCIPCTAKPSPPSSAWMGTWHDASFNPNSTATNNEIGQIIHASVRFTGIAVYVNCILTRSFTSPNGNSDMTFSIDDEQISVFQQSPDGNTTYVFDAPVFSQTGLSNTTHTLQIDVGLAGRKALILLDSIIYTTDDGIDDVNATSTASGSPTTTPTDLSQESNTKRKNVGIIVGPIVAAVLFVGFLAGGFYYMQRRRIGKESPQEGYHTVTPFVQQVIRTQDTHTALPSKSSTSQASQSLVGQVGDPTPSVPARAGVHFNGVPGQQDHDMVGNNSGERWYRPLPTISGDTVRSISSRPTQSGPSWPET